ncbi:flavin reductase like domain-containing protein [Trametes punicea]|nr:flavin reductase like domain-containing protein [Trametes punicea]
MLAPTWSNILRGPRVCTLIRLISTSASTVRDDLRALLRETAQPVAVVTALMDPAISQRNQKPNQFHGATLSSFSSISMDPHPLISFSLRIPSRMATSLTSAHSAASSAAHMVINILSEHQTEVAIRFSRPDLHPEPFKSLPLSFTEEGLPVLDGSVGALSCRLVAASWPLHDLEFLTSGGREGKSEWEGKGVASELFIAQVIRIERTLSDGPTARPLLYHRRGYVTTCDIESKPGSKASG